MSHLRLWQFEVPAEEEARFVDAYRSDGDWARLFATASGFIRTELWRDGDGIFSPPTTGNRLKPSSGSRPSHGEQYRRLDAELEGLSLAENFLGAFDLVQG